MPKTIRKELPAEEAEELGAPFVEFSTVWTHGELTEWADAQSGEKKLACVKRKIVAMRVPTVNGAELTTPEELIDIWLEDVDQRVFMWLEAVLSTIVLEVLDLGKALRSTVFASLAEKRSSANQTQ